MVEIADFVPHAPVPREIVDEYRGREPDELIEVWENYGYGTFGEGFLRIIDPKLYEAEVGDCIGKTQGDGIAIPVMTTGLGDLITWEPSAGVIGILVILNRVGGMRLQAYDFDNSVAAYEEGLAIARALVAAEPESVERRRTCSPKRTCTRSLFLEAAGI